MTDTQSGGVVRKNSPRTWKLPKDQYNNGHRTCGQRLKDCWADPKWRAELVAKRAATRARLAAEGNTKNNLNCIPKGMRLEQAKRFWRQAKFEAALTMNKLEEAGVLTDADEAAKEALKTALTVMRGPIAAKDKLAAARLVLDFTKAKPASKSEVTINKAEEWLAAVTEDNGKDNQGADRGA